MVFLVGHLVLAGCVAAAPSATDAGPANVSSAMESDATTPTNEKGVTAHFIVNNRGENTFNVTLHVVANLNESADYFPLAVTLRNGTMRTYTDTEKVQTVAEINAVAAEIEPANGTLVTVRRTLPPQSSLRVDVESTPEDAKSLVVVSRTGTASPPIMGFSLSSKICTGLKANIHTINESSSASTSCGNVSNVAFPDSLTRHSVPVNATSH